MMRFDRNGLCWCQSGVKYKKCHMALDQKINNCKAKGSFVPTRDIIKSEKQLEGIRESGKLNTWILDQTVSRIQAGITTEEINQFVHETTISKGGIPATLNYGGFPKSLCTSINHEICHGIPDEKVVLKDGDIVNIDITTIYNGYFADASRMCMIGNVSEDARRLVEVSKECMLAGVEAVKPWGHLGDIGAAVNAHAVRHGYTVVEDIGGHGVGLEFHEDPYVCHIGERGQGMLLVPGMVFTIEPMVNQGSGEFYMDEKNGWTYYTLDGLLSAQWEHTIAVTDTGIEIMTY